MTALDDDSDEEYLDDPIILIDFEQERINRHSIEEANGAAPGKIEVFIDLTDSDVEVSEKKSLAGNNTTLPVKHLDIPENVKLLNKCHPLCINVVDCVKHAWYYAKRIKSVELKSDLIVTGEYIDVCSIDSHKGETNKLQDRTLVVTPTTEMNMLNRSPGNKPKIRPVDISLYMGHSKHDSVKSRMDTAKKVEYKNNSIKLDLHSVTTITEKQYEEMHSEKGFKNVEVENQKIIDQKLRSVDFKKNQGLVGLKVTYATQTNIKHNEKKTDTKCLNLQEKSVNVSYAEASKKLCNEGPNRNLTKSDRRTPEKDKKSFSIVRINSPENVWEIQKKGKLQHVHENLTTKEIDKMVELQADPLRIKVVDRLIFENQKIPTKPIKSKPKQYCNKSDKQNAIRDQNKKQTISSAVDSVQAKKKKTQKNLTKHWKDTMRMFTKTKAALLNPKSSKTRIKTISGETKKLKKKNIHEPEIGRVKALSVNLNINKSTCIVNKPVPITDLDVNTSKKIPKYKDMPCLDEDEVVNESDHFNKFSKFSNLSQSAINTKSSNDHNKLKMKVSPKDISNNTKQLQYENFIKNTSNSQNNNTTTNSFEMNAEVKYTNKSRTQTSARVNNNVFGDNNKTNTLTSQTITSVPTNLSHQVHDNIQNSTKYITSKENGIQKNIKTIKVVCKSQPNSLLKSSATSAVPQHGENQDYVTGLPEATRANDDSLFNSDKQNVLPTKDKDDAATNLKTYIRSSRKPSAQSDGPFSSNRRTESENKIDASVRYTIKPPNSPSNEVKLSFKDNDVNFQCNSNTNIGNTQSNVNPMAEHASSVNTLSTQPNKHATVLDTSFHVDMDNAQSNVKPMMLNNNSYANTANSQPNASSFDKHAIQNHNKQVNFDHSQSKGNTKITITDPHMNMGNNQPNVNSINNNHKMVLNYNMHDNLGNSQANLNQMDNHAMNIITGSLINMGDNQQHRSLLSKHATMFKSNIYENLGNTQSHFDIMDSHAMMSNTSSHNYTSNNRPDVSSLHKNAMMENNTIHVNMDNAPMMANTGSHINIGNNQLDVSSHKHAIMLKNNMHVNLDTVQSNLNPMDKHAMTTITGSHNMSNNPSNINSIENKHAIALNYNTPGNMGNAQSNANQMDNHAMMTIFGSHNLNNNQPNVNLNNNKHAMMLNSNTHGNMGNLQSNTKQIDKNVMMINMDSNIDINNTQSNANLIDNHTTMLHNSSYIGNTQPTLSPNDTLAMTLNTLNQPLQNQVGNYYQPQERPIETVVSNVGRYYTHPHYMNRVRKSRPVNKSLLLNNGYVYNPNYDNRSPYMNFPANRFPYMYNSYNAARYTEFWNGAPQPIPPPPRSQIVQHPQPPKITEGSTVIGQNGDGLIRTINLKSVKSTPGNEGIAMSNHNPSDARPVNSKLEMLEELTKELDNVPDVECFNKQNIETSHKVEAHPNLTNLLSNEGPCHSLPNIITRPKTRPLSTNAEVASSAPQFPSFQNNAFETEYSPPILPIPTYQETLEMLKRMNMPQTASHSTDFTNPGQINCLEKNGSVNKKAPVRKNTGKRKRKLLDSKDEQVKMKKNASQECKINKDLIKCFDEYKKKISLEEYKQRVSQNRESVIKTVLEFDDKCGANKMTKDLDVKQNTDLDLGYDSDSTVKL